MTTHGDSTFSYLITDSNKEEEETKTGLLPEDESSFKDSVFKRASSLYEDIGVGLKARFCFREEGALFCSIRTTFVAFPRCTLRFTGHLVAFGVGVGLLVGVYKIWKVRNSIREYVESQPSYRQYLILYLIRNVFKTELGPDLHRKINLAMIAMLVGSGSLLLVSLEYFVSTVYVSLNL